MLPAKEVSKPKPRLLKSEDDLKNEVITNPKINDMLAFVAKSMKPKSEDEVGEFHTYDLYKHGISQSMINTFRSCERKFRLSNYGLVSMSESQALIYGSVFHEALDIAQTMIKNGEVTNPLFFDFDVIIDKVCSKFEEDYNSSSPEGKEFYEMSYGWARVTLPHYFVYWQQDFFGDTKKEFVEIECEFKVPYPSTIHSEKAVPLRGKRDGVVREAGKLWLWENKTKGTWNEMLLAQVVERDLQNNFYLKALMDTSSNGERVEGVIYNLIRRPQLRRKAKETMPEFISRCEEDIVNRPEFYFARLQVSISDAQRYKFEVQLHRQVSLIEQWFNNVKNPAADIEATGECVGVYGKCPYIGVCTSELTEFSGLYVRANLFPELDEANKEI